MPSSSGREVLDMNTDWAFYRGEVAEGSQADLDDSGWMPVALPHIMQLETKHCGGNSIYDGVGWYRRYFKLPAKYKDKRVVVSFEGVERNECAGCPRVRRTGSADTSGKAAR